VLVAVITSRSQLPQRDSEKGKEEKMFTKFICGLVSLGSFGFLLLGADSFYVGTWKLNVAKSKFAKGHEVRDMTVVITVEGDTATVTVNGTGGFMGAGKPVSVKYTVPTAGGPLTYIEGAPPAGISDVMKYIDERTDDITSTMNGKQIFMEHVVVSADRKTMIVRESGVDEKGQPYKAVAAYDRQ